LDAQRGAKISNAAKPVVLFLVVGETARAQNQQIDGYERETNPLLSKLDILNFGPATSCATSTIPSLRCLFSKFGRDQMSYVKFATHENLLDIAAHAKIAVEWYDNDWTFAEGGVTDRIKVERLYQRHDLAACVSGECDDAVFFDFLNKVIAQTTSDKLVVIHLVGSHFPYYRRYPAAFEVFKPACNSPVLESCTPQEIINAYDNSIRYTDYILAHFMETLRQQTQIIPALIYTSDHGESLGEGGVFLHSAPLSIAPPEQTTVPFFLWLSQPYIQTFGVNMTCLQQKAAAAISSAAAGAATTSHDNFFPTALGLLDIQTTERKPELDLTAGCL
jgi:lipid A ethanolaminephosphotransferase